MAKGFMHNGRHYSSKRAFVRQMRAIFASMPYERKKKVRPVIIHTKRISKKQPQVTGKNWKDVSTTIEKDTIIGPKEKKGKLELVESQQTYRINESTYIDADTHDSVRTVEAEEASRYTPAELDYHYEDLGNGVTQVNATKDKRIVSSTVTTITAPSERNEKIFYLEDKFRKWEKDPKHNKRLSSKELGLLGDSLGLQTGGGKIRHYQSTMEKRIRKKFASLELERKQDLDTRYRTFPQRTKSKITKSKGQKFENQDVINQILATELAHERVYSKEKKKSSAEIQQEMEDLLTGASKYRPDKNYNTTQLQLGTKVESEHTTRRLVAKDIAKDHLDEDPLYYQKLKKVEGSRKVKSKATSSEYSRQKLAEFEKESKKIKNIIKIPKLEKRKVIDKNTIVVAQSETNKIQLKPGENVLYKGKFYHIDATISGHKKPEYKLKKVIGYYNYATDKNTIEKLEQTKYNRNKVKIGFGKYRGKTIADIRNQDPSYFNWLKKETMPF